MDSPARALADAFRAKSKAKSFSPAPPPAKPATPTPEDGLVSEKDAQRILALRKQNNAMVAKMTTLANVKAQAVDHIALQDAMVDARHDKGEDMKKALYDLSAVRKLAKDSAELISTGHPKPKADA
ncbi:hypothetical protein HBH64_075820 [Parastagonospora nodorum]|nr:hypothetical protein HBI10_110580 [Parastagonospora nodorum]KAH4074320.1 hypothetical protein HBH50_045400 [Parastagonospora nodorum]KAH4285367.1 hypothetical protein HBI02_230590 [Parastagonospora nodorum]KAH4469951.1 hypothetical protein HBH90_080120 [Parastagonospora nodorum]KAH4481886.1 hypothetical protein HBH89_246310 [Parastagonospora nodorum]